MITNYCLVLIGNLIKMFNHFFWIKKMIIKEFILDLNFGLNTFLVDFELQVNNDILRQFVITEQIFEDGLTKDMLIRTMKRVFKAKLHCIWLIDKKFGSLPAPSNQNDMFI